MDEKFADPFGMKQIQAKPDVWAAEMQTADLKLSFRIKEVLHYAESKYQKILVVDTFQYGRMLLLDNTVMMTEGDEFFYHEYLTHVPMCLHKRPQDVLVIGGGDGGIINQLIKYEETESITLVEIDEEVVKAAKMFFPEMSRAFENPRVKVIFEDGIKYIDGKKEVYDVVIIDSTDPLGPAEGLFTPEFYGNVRAALKEDGLLAVQAESPVLTPELVREILKNIAIPFGAENIWYYIGFMPTYPTGMWGFALASKGPRKPELMVERAKKIAARSKCYNANVHKAALSLPNFVLELLPDGAPQKTES